MTNRAKRILIRVALIVGTTCNISLIYWGGLNTRKIIFNILFTLWGFACGIFLLSKYQDNKEKS